MSKLGYSISGTYFFDDVREIIDEQWIDIFKNNVAKNPNLSSLTIDIYVGEKVAKFYKNPKKAKLTYFSNDKIEIEYYVTNT
jgi:hypothetical protein